MPVRAWRVLREEDLVSVLEVIAVASAAPAAGALPDTRGAIEAVRRWIEERLRALRGLGGVVPAGFVLVDA